MAQVTVAEAIGRTLTSLGAAHVFGVTGSGNFHVTNALVDGGVPFTAARHEMGATTMADAYTRTTGKVAIVSLHQGCGLSNALTGIAEAAKCHTPIVVVSGDTAAGDRTSNFDIDQDAAVAAMGALPARIHSAASAVKDTAAAFAAAVQERRTVVLSMPVDIQDELVDIDGAIPTELPVRIPAGPSVESRDLIAKLLADAERPVIVGGRGARGARAELERLAEAAGALLITSAAARGLFVGNPWALDVMGGFATDGAMELVKDADLIVAFGAALNRWTTHRGKILGGARVVHVDVALEAIGRHRPVDVGVVGDAGEVAAAVAAVLEASGRPTPGYRTPAVAKRVDASRYWKDQPFTPRPSEGRVDPQQLVNRIDELVPLERSVVPDGGNVNCYAGAHLRVPDERGFVIPLSFQAIGMGTAAAIGMGLADRSRIPVLGTGDGAFMMSLVELDTAVRERLGMIILVFNDSAYGAEINLFEHVTDKMAIARFPETDIAAIARGFGCDGLTVRTIEEADAVQEWLDGPRNRPLVIDAKIAGFPSWLMERGRADRPAGVTAH